MTRPAEVPAPPRWITPWLAALPALYVISPLALLALPYLRRLPRPVWWVLGFYALSQQLPALFSPEPLLASLLALARTGLMFGLIGVGVALRDAQRLQPLALGLGVVYVTALASGALGGADLLVSRLSHPYMTSITLGLAGALGVWLALFTQGRLTWRVPFGLLALGVLLLSGSRGPLAATLVGCAAGFVIRRGWRLFLGVLAGAVLLAGVLSLGQRLELDAITRLGSADTTGRDIVWENTLSVIRSEPWSGAGSYRLGQHLAAPGDACELWSAPDGQAQVCPGWVRRLGSPWLIAHNVSLQQLAETGPLGLLGLFVLLGAVMGAALCQRHPLGTAVISGLLVATVNDNTLLVPSPFFAEVFWVVAGSQLLHLRRLGVGMGALTAALMLVLSAPLLASALPFPPSLPPRLALLNAPSTVSDPRGYTAFARFDLPPGRYRASLHSCLRSCARIVSLPFTVDAEGAPGVMLSGSLRPVRRQTLELRLHPGTSSLRLQPLGTRRWTVEVRP
ncbi:O-antigen ligase family protein [Deinococcus sp. YIM 134068]|uniref:O-antigen ligase family protein n=1 Tax=Deinococcus lichenicola TaxID=3118910 RepID=UPI002F944381